MTGGLVSEIEQNRMKSDNKLVINNLDIKFKNNCWVFWLVGIQEYCIV